ncbi:UNVERIFIED_CONTAM: hypothetical protein HDU68_007669 [Siphonaria sp. JEL0065]|nr:hypothetical protein HDU68_007669 [Siphonaria sp. JEL0065]
MEDDWLQPLRSLLKTATERVINPDDPLKDLDALAAPLIGVILFGSENSPVEASQKVRQTQKQLVGVCTILCELAALRKDVSFTQCLALVGRVVASLPLASLWLDRLIPLLAILDTQTQIQSNALVHDPPPPLAELPLSSAQVARLLMLHTLSQAPLSTVLKAIQCVPIALAALDNYSLDSAVAVMGVPLAAGVFVLSCPQFTYLVNQLLDTQQYSRSLIFDLLSAQPTLFAILSSPECVKALSSLTHRVINKQHPTLSHFLSNLLALSTNGIASILKQVVHGKTISHLALDSPCTIQILTFQLSLLYYHSQTATGIAELLEFSDSKSFVAMRGITTRVTLFTQLVSIARYCKNALANNSLSTIESSRVLDLSITALKLVNQIKNSCYDLNLLGVLIASPKRPICQVTKMGPLFEVADVCVGLVVLVERRLSGFRNGFAVKAGNVVETVEHNEKLSSNRGIHYVHWTILESLAVEVLHDMVSIVAFEHSQQLNPFLTNAQFVEAKSQSDWGNSGRTLTRAILPRFFQRVSSTFSLILGWLDKNPWDYKHCFELMKVLMPSSFECDEKNPESQWILKMIWTQELGMIQPQFLRAIRIFGFTSDLDAHESLKDVVKMVLEATTGFEFCREFCSELGNHLCMMLMETEADESVFMDSREGRWESVLRWFLVLRNWLEFPEGVQASISLTSSIANIVTTGWDWNQHIEPCMDFVLRVIRSSFRYHGELNPDLVKPLTLIAARLALDCRSMQWTPSFDFYLAYILASLPILQAQEVLGSLRQQPNDWVKDTVIGYMDKELCSGGREECLGDTDVASVRKLDFLVLWNVIVCGVGYEEELWFESFQELVLGELESNGGRNGYGNLHLYIKLKGGKDRAGFQKEG